MVYSRLLRLREWFSIISSRQKRIFSETIKHFLVILKHSSWSTAFSAEVILQVQVHIGNIKYNSETSYRFHTIKYLSRWKISLKIYDLAPNIQKLKKRKKNSLPMSCGVFFGFIHSSTIMVEQFDSLVSSFSSKIDFHFRLFLDRLDMISLMLWNVLQMKEYSMISWDFSRVLNSMRRCERCVRWWGWINYTSQCLDRLFSQKFQYK